MRAVPSFELVSSTYLTISTHDIKGSSISRGHVSPIERQDQEVTSNSYTSFLPSHFTVSDRDVAYTSVEAFCRGKWFCDLAFDWPYPKQRDTHVRASTRMNGFVYEAGCLDQQVSTILTYLHNSSFGG